MKKASDKLRANSVKWSSSGSVGEGGPQEGSQCRLTGVGVVVVSWTPSSISDVDRLGDIDGRRRGVSRGHVQSSNAQVPHCWRRLLVWEKSERSKDMDGDAELLDDELDTLAELRLLIGAVLVREDYDGESDGDCVSLLRRWGGVGTQNAHPSAMARRRRSGTEGSHQVQSSAER